MLPDPLGDYLDALAQAGFMTEDPGIEPDAEAAAPALDALLGSEISTRTELSKVASGKALDAVIEAIVDAVAKGDGVSLVGFGSFKAAARAAREGKNPKTGEKIKIAATTVPKFSAGATFKATVANAKGKKKK